MRHDDAHPVAELKGHLGVGEHIRIAAAHASDDRVETRGHVKIGNRATSELRVRDDEPAEVDLGTVVREMGIAFAPEERCGLVDCGGYADHEDPVPRVQRFRRVSNANLVAALQVRNPKVAAGLARQ